MAKEQSSNPNWNSNSNNSSYASSCPNDQSRLQEMENRINQRSAQKTREYLSTHQSDDGKLTEDKVFLVYKFNSTSQRTLVSGMIAQDSLEQAKSYFNKIALQVHPDKNSHPLAESVFKKLRESFDEAKLTLKQR